MQKGILCLVLSVFFTVAAGEEWTGHIDSSGTKMLTIPLEAYQTYLISLESPPAADFDLYVYGPHDSMIGKSLKTNQLDGVVFSTQAADSYRIEIRPVVGAGNYKVSVVTLAMEEGYLQQGESWQYLLDLKFGGRCYLLLTPEECNLDLFVYDRFNYLIAKSESPEDQPEELEFRAPVIGTEKYTIEVCAKKGSGNYRLLFVYDTK
jgi:hypothetical protein